MFNLPNGATTNCLQDLKRKKRHHELQSNQQPHQNLKVKKIKTESSYEKIRTQLHLSSTTKTELLGRTSELAQVTSFFEKHLKSQQPGSLFISGPPGTGKTHLIFHFSDKLRKVETCGLLISQTLFLILSVCVRSRVCMTPLSYCLFGIN
jgi:chromosomal replication initiation ATPase DnaA